MSDQQLTVTTHEVVDAMRVYGGDFIHALALAWYAADEANRFLIQSTWGREWRQYTEMAQQIKEARHDR